MPLPQIFPAEGADADLGLSASVRQLEALTALAAAPRDGRALEQVFVGLADTITNLTDYRSCLVLLFTDEPPHRRRVVSHSSNIPRDYLERSAGRSYPREAVERLIERGVRIEVGALGFAAYYPPSHYAVIDEFAEARFKADLPRPRPDYGAAPWNKGDELFVPLITHDGELVGLIALDDPRTGRAPDRQSVLPAVAFARQMAQLVARQRDAERLSAQAEREALVNRITRAVRQSLDAQEVFRTAVNELGLHLGVDRCALFMIDATAGLVRNTAEYAAPGVLPGGSEYRIPPIAGLLGRIREHGVVAFEDAAGDAELRHVYESFLRPLGTRSIVFVGIRVGEEVTGAFTLSTVREQRRWRESDLAVARAVADQTGIAIRQAKLYQRAEATSAREALVNRLGHAIRASLSLSEVLRTATHELGRALGASRVYLRPYDPERAGSAPVTYEYLADGCPSLSGHTISYDRPVGRHLIGTQRTLVVHDVAAFDSGSEELNAHLREMATRTGSPSKIICPLVVQGRFRGALCIHQTGRVRRWARDEVALVESVAAQLATAVAQAELFEMVERAKRTWEVTFDAMSDGIFIFSNERKLLRVNRAGAGLEAAEPQELLGRGCCDILRAGRGEGCIVERVVAEGRAVTLEYTPESLNRPLLLTAEPILEGAAQVGTVCTVRDLTELRRVESLARERQVLLERVLESARENICAVDTEGRVMWINSAGGRMNGYPKEELIGRHFAELIDEADRGAAFDRFRRVLAGEAQTVELRLVTREGQVRYVTTDSSPIVIDGRTTGVLAITRDVTEQREERERAAQADKLRALGQLASGVAHDFNNALAAILGRAQLLRRAASDPEVARNLDIIQTAAEDAAATVRRIRSFAHQGAGDEFAPLDVGGLLRDAVEITRTRWENDARARGLSYDVSLDAGCALHVRGNASELREVFVNLIVNAIDAMPGGGRLSIRCRRAGPNLQLLFEDTGAGMSEEVRARIFEPFFTTKGNYGTGLGLFVSYGIVERHRGRVTVESARGRGTTFTVELPAVEPLAPPRGCGEGAKEPAAPALSVLVIDDEEAVRTTLAEMVEALGHRVTAVDGGQAALRALEASDFDLVFSDLSMPGMDGWEVAREIRRRRPSARVVIVTGYGREAARAGGAAAAAADAVIGKPFDFRQIEEMLARFGACE
jgi:PAS domain S-box-containing protein